MAEIETKIHHGSVKILEGVVIPCKMTKTIVVEVARRSVHPVVGKQIEQRKKYHVDDPQGLAHVGDTVQIVECRPISATKRFRLVKVVKKGA
ncbi:MAG TPA: 30S ribosomal protein S17 [Firmicutes bacterium]|nr:30S ribosomal protein S17 [Bacillota bacterium]